MDLLPIKEFAKGILQKDQTAHDWKHALRVEKNARKIIPSGLTDAEIDIIRAACWLHDTIDEKISEDSRQAPEMIEQILLTHGATREQADEILSIIQNLSYSKNLQEKVALSELGQIVQDADRLDAIGAIGIARAFYYGGSQGEPLYSGDAPRSPKDLTEANYRKGTSVVNHFYEKLLLLEEQMNTDAGKFEAKKRTNVMEEFLEQLAREI